MELVSFEFHKCEFFVGDFVSDRVAPCVEFSVNLQSLRRGGVGDQLDDYLVTDKRTTSPVLCDVAEHPMFDLVPFARAGRKMADFDRQLNRLAASATLLSTTDIGAVAAAAVRREQPVGWTYRLRPIFCHQR